MNYFAAFQIRAQNAVRTVPFFWKMGDIFLQKLLLF